MTLARDVAPGVHRIADAFVNFYLVEDHSGVLVIDAGLPSSWSHLLAALSDIGRTREEVRALVLTHAHFDHMGFARRIHREWDCPVLVSESDRPLARHPLVYRMERPPVLYLHHPTFVGVLASFLRSRAPVTRGLGETSALPAQGVLDVPGRPVVVPTPGHTHGHVSLHFPERDALVAGDAIVTLDPYTGRRGPRLVSRAATADSRLALRSLDAIEATRARIVLPGHGEPWTQGAPQAAALARAAGHS